MKIISINFHLKHSYNFISDSFGKVSVIVAYIIFVENYSADHSCCILQQGSYKLMMLFIMKLGAFRFGVAVAGVN